MESIDNNISGIKEPASVRHSRRRDDLDCTDKNRWTIPFCNIEAAEKVTMKPELYTRVILIRDVPEKRLFSSIEPAQADQVLPVRELENVFRQWNQNNILPLN